MKAIISIFFLILASHAFSQNENSFTKKTFIVLEESVNYSKALRRSQRWANYLQIPLDLRSLTPDSERGLTSNQLCDCGENHGYIPRGRFDDGIYISIEHSSGYSEAGSRNRYFIVAYIGDESSGAEQYDQIKAKCKKAQIRTFKIYQGCMH